MQYFNPGSNNRHPLAMEGMGAMTTIPMGTTTQMAPSIGGNGYDNVDFLSSLSFGRSSSAPAAFASSFHYRSRRRHSDLTDNLISKKNKKYKHKVISISSLASFSSAAPSLDGNDDALNSRGGDQSISFSQLEQRQEQRRHIQRIARADEPNLYDIPSTLHATYKPMPLFLKFMIGIGSLVIVGRSKLVQIVTSSSFQWTIASAYSTLTNAFVSLPSALRSFSLNDAKNQIFYLFRTFIVAILSTLGIQEVLFRPSRVTTQYLMENDLLPSKLSSYKIVTPVSIGNVKKSGGGSHGEVSVSSSSWEKDDNVPRSAPRPIGVHFIQYFGSQNSQQRQEHQHVQEQEPKLDSSETAPETTAKQQLEPSNVHAIYLHHGFGASSLSWLPVLPPLVERLRARQGIAHDAVGFGFTDRPDEKRGNSDFGNGYEDGSGGCGAHKSTTGDQYSVENNVGIGLALLNDSMNSWKSSYLSTFNSGEGEDSKSMEDIETTNEEEDIRSIAIFGHSMGAKAALIMAKTLSEQNSPLKPKLVVLVAPALEGVSLAALKRGSGSSSYAIGSRSGKCGSSGVIDEAKKWIGLFVSAWKTVFVDLPFQYGLRRLVSGNRNFWKSALKNFVWGDPQKLTHSDVLRFQWPSIGKDWERGLLSFSRSRLSASTSSPFDDDGTLLREVVSLEGVRVVIMYGSKDRIVGIDGAVAERLKQDYPNVKFVRLEGMGHDPFEEDVDVFLNELGKVIGQTF